VPKLWHNKAGLLKHMKALGLTSLKEQVKENMLYIRLS